MKKRRLFVFSAVMALVGWFVPGWARKKKPLLATPGEIEGPFYPIRAQKDKDFDLTRVEGREGQALGAKIIVEGRVTDTAGEPLENATVDLWQANAAGRYRHSSDTSKAPLDPAFQGWAIVASGKDGKFRFKTVLPGAYRVSRGWTRPPHIHFKVSKNGFKKVTTQMYFAGQKLNDNDQLLLDKNVDERKMMIASEVRSGVYRYNIVLAKG